MQVVTKPRRIIMDKSTRYFAFALAATAFTLSSAAFAAPGEFDRSFAQNGIATFPTETGSAAYFVTTDAAGRVLATGKDRGLEFITRLMPNGSLDSDFAFSGFIRSTTGGIDRFGDTLLGHTGQWISNLADGQILATRVDITSCQPAICRFKSQTIRARRFNAFGNPVSAPNGDVEISRGFRPTQVVEQESGGKFFVTGTIGYIETTTTLARLKPDGLPDDLFQSYSDLSLTCRALGTNSLRASRGAALGLASNKTLLAQGVGYTGTSGQNVCISRLKADGTVDQTYAVGGDLIIGALFSTNNYYTPVALFAGANDSAILLLRMRFRDGLNTREQYQIVWLTADGQLDKTKPGQGISSPTVVHVGKLMAAAIQPNGKIVIAGFSETTTPIVGEFWDPAQPRIGRLLPDGTSDSSFGPAGQGYVSLVSDGKRLNPNQLHIAADGSVFIAGELASTDSATSSPVTQFALAKMQGDPAPAPIVLTTSASAAAYGAPVTLSVGFARNAQGGTVTFSVLTANGQIELPGCGNVPVIAGVANCIAPGAYQNQPLRQYIATYSGDPSNAGAKTSISQTVATTNAVLTVAAMPLPPISSGRSTTLTALVKMSNPVGSVTFSDNGVPIAGCAQKEISLLPDAIDSAVATCTLTAPTATSGVKQYVATYFYPSGHVSGKVSEQTIIDLRVTASGPADYTDMWWAGPAENGWGMSVTQHGPIQFNVIFAYDANGKAIWYVMPGGSFNAVGTVFTGSLYLPTSSPFSAYDKSKFVIGPAVGTASITYNSNGTASLAYIINGISGSKSIQRQAFATETAGANLRTNDLWWATAAEDGWGMNIAQQGRVLFPVWFTYDSSGKATFFTAQGGSWNGTVWSGTLFTHASSAWLGAAYDPSMFSSSSVGTLTIDFTDASTATMTTTLNGIMQVRRIVRQPY